MSQENVKPDQIQASVAAALSRLRGDLAPPSDASSDTPRPTVPREPTLSAVPQSPMAASRPEPANDLRAEATLRPIPGSAMPEAPAETPPPVVEPELPRAMFSRPRFVPPVTPDPPPITPAVQRTSGPLSRMMGKATDEEPKKPMASSAAAASPTAQPDLLAGLPPPPLGGALIEDSDGVGQHRRRNRRLLAIGVALVAAVIGVWVWTLRSGGPTDVPVIAAETTPEKVKPVDEGGLQVPNQNVQVLDNIDSNAEQQASGETVLPPPEQPVAPPAPAIEETQPAEAQADAADAATTTAQSTPTVAAPEPPAVEAPAVEAPAVEAPATTEATSTASQTSESDAASTAKQTEPTVSEQPATTQTTAAPEPTPPPEPAPTATQEAAVAPAPAAGNAKIQLAAVKSEDSAKESWAKLQKAFPDLLGNLKLTIQKVDKGSSGVFYRIQAGPLADKAAAKELCGSLKQRGQDCLVAK